MNKHRTGLTSKSVGELSSKYAYDGGASLDADVADKEKRYKQLHDDILKAFMKSDLQVETLRLVFVEILEDLGVIKERR